MENDRDLCVPLIFLAFVLAVFVGCIGWNWYRSGVQHDVYQRQGIQISRWEVFIGTKPAEQVIQLKETK